jgi:D-serine deaminase-like pyridoxal phosphate-dependent protein
VHQEHGIVGARSGLGAIAPLPFGEFAIGDRLLVLPNHVCMTAAMHDRYYVVDGPDDTIVAEWPRVAGW